MAKKDKARKHEAESTRTEHEQHQSQQVQVPEGEKSEGGEQKAKGSNAPRARKHDYGIKPEAKVVRLVEVANVKRDIQNQFNFTEGDPTVEEFYKRGGDRHGLRVMSRRKLIEIQHLNEAGEVIARFPQAYVKPEKPETEESA